MSGKKSAKKTEPSTVVADDPADRQGRLQSIGGSQSDHWNNALANQTLQAVGNARGFSVKLPKLPAEETAVPFINQIDVLPLVSRLHQSRWRSLHLIRRQEVAGGDRFDTRLPC
jgi:hypothetical protein